MNQYVAMPAVGLGRANEAGEEQAYHIPAGEIRGKLPEELRGTFFRIGPGRYEVGGQAFGHAFDGDGMLHSVTFADNGAHYRNRFVQTRKYRDETAAQAIVHRSLGHNAPGGWRKNAGRGPANCANTSLIWHGGHLLALWEGGRPYELDPVTLETLGEFNYGGRLTKANAFSAHGKVDPRTGNYYNFGIGMGLRGPCINFYRIDARGCLDKKGQFPISTLPFCHDFALTEHYAVFFIAPLHVRRPAKSLLGFETFMDAFTFEPEKATRIFVVSLATFEVVRTFETEGFIPVHYANCWEQGRELVIHMTHFTDWIKINHTLASPATNPAGFDLSQNDKSGLWRYRLNLGTGRVSHEILPGHDNIEFMQWDYRRTGVASGITYAVAAMPHPGSFTLNAVQRQDHGRDDYRLHDFGAGTLISETVFAARNKAAAEGEGYLITAAYRAATHSTDIVILDADSLDEIATVPLRKHIPVGFHCGYTSRSFV